MAKMGIVKDMGGSWLGRIELRGRVFHAKGRTKKAMMFNMVKVLEKGMDDAQKMADSLDLHAEKIWQQVGRLCV